jgi:glycosyltransferase involved in cell wall biosynthesis
VILEARPRQTLPPAVPSVHTPLRIGVDAGPLLGEGGISSYVGPLVRALLATDERPECRLVLRRGWISHPAADSLSALAPVTRIGVPDRLLSFWWNRLGWPFPWPRDLWRDLDVFLATCLFTPRVTCGKIVSIVYDLIPLRLPALFPNADRFRQQVERLLSRSAAVIAISQCTRRDLVSLLGADPARITVIYPGCTETFRPAAATEVATVAARYGIRGPYILYVGSLGPHKNVPTLLAAFRRARLERGLSATLVLVGSHRWGAETLAALTSLPNQDDILTTGPVPLADLPPLYTGAACFVYPSYYEGFGLPVLEAMACGAPVIVSRAGALPEVVGDAGVLVDPRDPADLATAMCRVCRDSAFRNRMASASLVQATRFSWTQSAADTMGLLREVAAQTDGDD